MARAASRRICKVLVFAALGVIPTEAQTFTVLYSFTGSPDGASPASNLIGDGAGDLIGTTEDGGASGHGTVFRVNASGETVLYSFQGGRDGSLPEAGLIRDSVGNLFGTTLSGGNDDGTVYKLDTAGTETVLYRFSHAGGLYPAGGLTADSAGNLYGAAEYGGAHGLGTIYKLNGNGETVLHGFTGVGDGATPTEGLIRDAEGNLYGTTSGGGAFRWGTVFKLDAAGTETVLYSFTGGADGANPYSTLIRDAAGNLYGTAMHGGIVHGSTGFGVVFKLDPAGNQTVLYSFTGGADGAHPTFSLVQDADGNLYGTTESGGIGNGLSGPGDGVVFKVDTAGNETVLHSFTGGADGLQPEAALFRDSAGNLYGTTVAGGIVNGACEYGCGVVFKIAP